MKKIFLLLLSSAALAAEPITPQGQLAGGTPGENCYNKKWRFNSPAIRLKATPIDSGNEENLSSVYLALEVLAFVVLFILYLKARRRTS